MMLVPLSYSQLFPNDDLFETSSDLVVPSPLTIAFLSSINHRLYIDEDPDDIFKEIIKGWDEKLKKLLILRIQHIRQKRGTHVPIFSEWIVTELIKNELLNHNELEFDIDAPTGAFEMVIIVRYFKYVDVLLPEVEANELVKDDQGRVDFQRTSYHSLIKQFQFTRKTHPIFEMLCCYSFLKVMQEKYPEETKNYIESYGVDSEWKFAGAMIDFIKEAIATNNPSSTPLLRADSPKGFHKLFEQRILNVEEYKNDKKLQLRYQGIQSKPLYKLDSNYLCVMSWHFLYNNIGTGVLFDYFKSPKIKNIYKSFPKFKSEIVSLDVYERKVFRPLMKAIFEKKHTVLEFDDGTGHPDCYMRQGNRIFLIEFKDMLFSDNIVDNGGYEEIMKLCKRNLIENDKGKAKGLGQIAKQIEFLNNGNYGFDKFSDRKLKRKSISIYPILIYSHKQFSFSGINKYVIEEFEKILMPNNFKYICKPILISLDYIFSRKLMFLNVRLDKIIKKYHKQIRGYELNLNRGKHLDENKWFKSLMGQYNSIELCRMEFDDVIEDDSGSENRLIHKVLNEFGIVKQS